MKLFLDDVRTVRHVYDFTLNEIYLDTDWVTVRTYDDFCEYIKNNPIPEVVSFDHDLSEEHYEHLENPIPYNEYMEKTGYDCAKFLINYCLENNKEIPTNLIHSKNPAGKANIIFILNQAKTGII